MSDSEINIFALTDCHQEARKLSCLFSGIIEQAPQNGKNTLICDCGDLFKGIYDRELCVSSYMTLRQALPEAKIVLALGNNDFGFNLENFKFLKNVSSRFNQANIHVLCANLFDVNTETYPTWVDPYILMEINHKKVLVTSFCINQIRLQKYGVRLIDIPEAFVKIADAIKHIEPDVLLVMNHALLPSSLAIYETAKKCGISIDVLLGGHEHSVLPPLPEKRIYYPRAFSRTMLQFKINPDTKDLNLIKEWSWKECKLNPIFVKPIEAYEELSGLNIPVAKSTLNLERQYSNPCPLGSFIADIMKNAAKTKIAMFSTGYACHALRYEKDKILTHYNIERAFSAEVPLQTVEITAEQLKAVLNNAVKNRYTQYSGNVRFLQCSQNMTIYCTHNDDMCGIVKQILINNEPLLDDDGNPLHPDEIITCAVDPFVGAGEQGFDVLKSVSKETLMRNNQLVKIKDLFLSAIKEAETKYTEGSSYPSFKLIDLKEKVPDVQSFINQK